ncbi:Alpha-1,3-arabinosyltransferase XAT3 [Thalictrum thalictroides]|uniref:Alpha-1,3-arabinosyltransferase XAT3 n=1 Tax=Thalictrum thalictroides TaxID=46969 RepID=A0A7J6V1M6_THATH|nr:Alpha-1,3-arabinosyltransferase XAT3 [Thalictrum thalictroides]
MIIVILVIALLVVFYLHQITFSSISSLSSSIDSTITVQGKQFEDPPIQISGSTSQPIKIKCDYSHYRYDICFLNASTVVNPPISTLFLTTTDPIESTLPRQQFFKLRPYPRKWDNLTMSRIKDITLTTTTTTHCDVYHNAPALVFSTGGYTGNVFHDFNEGFIPLFITIKSVFSDRDPIFVIDHYRDWWFSKYAEIIRQFTPYPIIDLDTDTRTHCFPSATVGLISNGFMNIDPKLLPHSETLSNFRAFLGNAYLYTNHDFSPARHLKPRLVLVSRSGDVGRVIKNQADVIQVAEKIGFEVVLFQPNKYTTMSNAYGLINSSHAMLGVHGAALTHFLFLRPGSVFIQVVPIGVEWLAETCFGKTAKDIGADYMEYKIRVQESSLVEKYGRDHQLVLNGQDALGKMKFDEYKNIYLKSQDVILDLERIGKYLRKAYKKAKRFMDKQG